MPFGPKELVDVELSLLATAKPVADAPGYFINRDGQVFCIRQLSPREDDDGYERVCLFVNKRKRSRGIHQLLAIAFLPPPGPGQDEVRHLDGNTKNISIDNLAWGTRAQNAADMAKHGTLKGSRNPKAIINEMLAFEISRMALDNTAKTIAWTCDIPLSAVKAVMSGQNWSHVTGIVPKKERILLAQAEAELGDL